MIAGIGGTCVLIVYVCVLEDFLCVCIYICFVFTCWLGPYDESNAFQFNDERNSSGIEGNPTVFYRLIRGSTAQTNKYDTFYLQQRADNGHTWADIKVNHPLDYENIKEYNLTIRVEVSYLQQRLVLLRFWRLRFPIRITVSSSWPARPLST